MLNSSDVERVVGTPLFNSKYIPFCITSNSLKFEYVNEIFCELAGYSKQELEGQSISILIGPKQMIQAVKEYFYFKYNKKNQQDIWRVKNKRGKTITAKIETSSIEINDVSYNLVFTLDYTELDESKDLVQASEEKYRLLTETMPHIVWSNDVSGKPIYMNTVAKKYFGKDEKDFENWDWLNYFDIEDARELEIEWDIASQMKNPIQKVSRLKNKAGEFKWFQIILYPQFNDIDDAVSWTAIATDINDRIKAEEKLSKANKRLRMLFDAAPIPIYTLNDQGVVKDLWNPAAERILGWSKDEVVGKQTPLASPDHYNDFADNLASIKKTGQLKKTVTRTIRNGDDITLELNGGCIYDNSGNIDEILITLLDITELEHKKIHLEDSLKEKKTLLQEIHHRVKNNLAIVVSLLQLQVYQSTSKKEKNKLLDAQNRVMSIAMVHELLYSSEEFNKVNLSTYYEQLIHSVKANMTTGTKGVEHIVDVGTVELNITQAIPLGLLVNELVTNSLKYAFPQESNGNSLCLNITQQDEMIQVKYSDNGVGFDMETESFTTGLGFKIIDSLLNQLDANYDMVSNDGFQLTFSFKRILLDEEAGELV